jgi:hypothetical protein
MRWLDHFAFVLALFAWVGAAHAEDLSAVSTEQLIDRLVQIDSAGPGLHPSASVGGFIGDDTATRFAGGVIGSAPPVVSPPMRELVRRGVAALRPLIAHLRDSRPTKLRVGGLLGETPGGGAPGIGGGFMFQEFAEEYDPREPVRVSPRQCVESCISPEELAQHGQDGQYTPATRKCI